jgi:hypothetical protein
LGGDAGSTKLATLALAGLSFKDESRRANTKKSCTSLALTWRPFGERQMELLIATEKPFAAEAHPRSCIRGVSQSGKQCGSCIETYRCFFSFAARAVASSTMSGRNGIPSARFETLEGTVGYECAPEKSFYLNTSHQNNIADAAN